MVESSEWRSRRGWTTAVYALVAVAALLLLVLDRPGSRPSVLDDIRAHTGDWAAPVMSAVSAPIRGLRSIFGGASDYWAAVDENRELRQEIAQLNRWRDLALSLRDKVRAYESILDIPGVDAADPIGAWSVADASGSFVHARLIDAGWDRGVREGHPVLTERGLVGRVVVVGHNSARVLLLTDLNSRIPVMTEDGEARALLTGDNSSAPRLEFVNRDAVLEQDERIVTSGDGGLLPRGLPVGQAAPASGDAWRVRLYSSGDPVDMVWVYPYDPIMTPEENPVPQSERLIESAEREARAEAARLTAEAAAESAAPEADAEETQGEAAGTGATANAQQAGQGG